MSAHVANRFATKSPHCAQCAVAMRCGLATTRAGRAPSFGFATTITVTPSQKRFTPCRNEYWTLTRLGAALEAGAIAGGYLEEIGTTDLAALSGEQWREFLRRFVIGFEQAMRRKILENEAPF